MNELCFGVYIKTKNYSIQGKSLIKELITIDHEAKMDMKTIGILARNSAALFFVNFSNLGQFLKSFLNYLDSKQIRFSELIFACSGDVALIATKMARKLDAKLRCKKSILGQ